MPGFFKEEHRKTTKVLTKTLDRFLSEQPGDLLARVGLIWVDIQGHEGHFFLGARSLLARPIPIVSEFWPYGIWRSGMPQSEFQRTVTELFTDYYVLSDKHPEKKPINDLEDLFKIYREPRQVCLLAYVRE